MRAHLLELAGDGDGARAAYRAAAVLAGHPARRRYVHGRADRLGAGPAPPPGGGPALADADRAELRRRRRREAIRP